MILFGFAQNRNRNTLEDRKHVTGTAFSSRCWEYIANMDLCIFFSQPFLACILVYLKEKKLAFFLISKQSTHGAIVLETILLKPCIVIR